MAAFTVIDHTELGAAAASWTTGSIPSSYDHLYLVASTRSDQAVYAASLTLQVGNSGLDTGTNYSFTMLYANTTTPASSRFTGQDGINYLRTCGSSATADTFATFTTWIPNYANTANFKQILGGCSAESANTGDSEWEVQLRAGLWSSTSAITDVGMDVAGNDFMQYSTFTLYGVTGA